MNIRVVIGSKNPAKITAVERAFIEVFPDAAIGVVPCDVKSGVSDQPIGDEETLLGARNRAAECRFKVAELVFPGSGSADKFDMFYVGLEGGCARRGVTGVGSFWETFGWVYVRHEMTFSVASTGSIPLPAEISREIQEGKSLGEICSRISGNQKINEEEGYFGMMTAGRITRDKEWHDALVSAICMLAHGGSGIL